MDLDDYQKSASTTAVNTTVEHFAFGLLEEAGEIAAVFKRVWRHDEGYLDSDDLNGLSKVTLDKLRGELGDILWYTAMLADICGMSLNDVASHNLTKLQSRKQRDMIRGSGDDR